MPRGDRWTWAGFLSKLNIGTGCWEWAGCREPSGYGATAIKSAVAAGIPRATLAQKYSIDVSQVSNIVRGRQWADA